MEIEIEEGIRGEEIRFYIYLYIFRLRLVENEVRDQEKRNE